ncbi:cytochrome b [Cognatiyoonia sp.]|uniref:cytochrome b n=1 Tax=Cognatiyoonia sp. TaxID=2211652 RepID=UPI003F694DE5
MTTPAKPHSFITRSIHWASAALIAFGYFKGLDNVSQLADPNLLRTEVIFSLLLGGLFALRLLWTKKVAGHTRLPTDAPRWEKFASQAVHVGLYASVFLIVISGLGIALGYTTPVLSGLFLSAMIGLHEFALAALPILLITHIAGALWHRFIRRDGIFESMVPGLSSNGKAS